MSRLCQHVINDCLENSLEVIRTYGELGNNIFSAADIKIPEVLHTWINEKKNYNYLKDKCDDGKDCSNYTQVNMN